MRKKTFFIAICIMLLALNVTACSGRDSETVQSALRALESGDYESASDLFDQAIGEGKDLQYVYRGKGIAQMGMMQYEEAAETFQTALDSEVWVDRFKYGDDLVKDIRQYQAVCYVRSGDYDKAIELYDLLLEDLGESPELLTDRGAAKAYKGKIEDAKADFDRAINLERNNYERILQIAQVLQDCGAGEIGAAYLQGVASLDSAQIDPILQGRILYFLGDYERAVKLLKNAALADEEAAMIRCRSYIAMGDTDSALDVLESFGSMIEGSPSLLGLLGSVRMEQGLYEEALDAFTRGLAAAENSQDLQEMQELLFDKVVANEYLGNFAQARELLAEYLEKYPGDEEAAREMQFLQTR